MFNRTSLRTVLGAAACSLLLTSPAWATARFAGGVSSVLVVGSEPVSYGALEMQCGVTGDIGSGFKLSFSNEMPGLQFADSAVFTFSGPWTGDASARTVRLSSGGISFEPAEMPTCEGGGILSITGLQLRYTGSVTSEQSHLLVRPTTSAATVVASRSIVLAGTAAQQVAPTQQMVSGGVVQPEVQTTPKEQTTVPVPETTPSVEISYPSIRINDQASYTKSQTVALDLYATNATQMQIGNSANLASATWVSYAPSATWKLTSGKGTKTVCVRYRNAAKTSTTECDTILYDANAKVPSAASVIINKGALSTTSTVVTLAIKATNASEMRISNGYDMSGAEWIPYKTAISWNMVSGGERSVYVQFRSSSLLESGVVHDSIYIGYPTPDSPTPVQISGLVAGDLIKLPTDGDPTTTHDQTVYYYGADAKRHAFPSQRVYESWFVGFGAVKIVSLDTLSSIPLGMPMLVRPGTFLVKSPSMNRVYVVTAGGVLRPLKNEAAAIKHFGKGWSSRVIDLADGFFASYTMNTSEYTESSVIPDGTVVEANGTRWYVESGDLYPFTSNGFADNGFQDKFVVKLEKKPNYSTRTSINGRSDKHSKFYYRNANGVLIGV